MISREHLSKFFLFWLSKQLWVNHTLYVGVQWIVTITETAGTSDKWIITWGVERSLVPCYIAGEGLSEYGLSDAGKCSDTSTPVLVRRPSASSCCFSKALCFHLCHVFLVLCFAILFCPKTCPLLPEKHHHTVVLLNTNMVHSCLILNYSHFQKKSCHKNCQNPTLELISSVDLYVGLCRWVPKTPISPIEKFYATGVKRSNLVVILQ